MKYDLKNNKYFRWGLTAFLTIAASICFYYLLFHGNSIKAGFHTITGILMPVLYGLVTAYLLTPVLNYIETKLLFPLCRKLKVKENKKRNSIVRGIGILITAFLFIALIYSLVAMMLSQIVPSIVNIASNFDTYISNFTKWISKIMDDNPELGSQITLLIDKYSVELENWLNNTVLTKTSQVLMTVSLSVINILKGLWDFIIGFVISIYVLASKEKFAGQAKKIAYALLNTDHANIFIKDIRFTSQTFIGFLSGKIVDSIIIGILCFVGLSILKMPYAILVSVIVGVTNIIPFFGPYLGAIPSALLILLVNPLKCLYFIIFILVLQQLDGNVIGPKILGQSTGLSGFWVIFSITIFGGLWGVAGMIVGVPLWAVIYALVKRTIGHKLKNKGLPVETQEYLNVDKIKDKEFIMLDPDTSKRSKKKIKQMNKNSDPHKSADAPNEETRQEVLSETPVMGSESLENTEVIKEEDSEK